MEKQEQIERKLELIISRGRWQVMDRLPPERSLAEEFQVSRNTLRTAIRALCGRGILETKRGSGTIVRMLPGARPHTTSLFESLRLKTEAFRLVMPPVMVQCALRITPSSLLALELLLPQAGAALRSYNIRDFAQIQSKFFMELTKLLDNSQLSQVVARLLPEGRELIKLLESHKLARSEPLFSTLVRLLNALRRADPDSAAECTGEYASIVLQLLNDAR